MNTFEKDKGKMIQVASAPLSEALITVDSRDGIKYDTATGLVSANKNPFDININIGTQFFGSGVRRLRLKEALITWNIPNVNPTNNILFLEKDDATTYNVVVPTGFYTPNELGQAIESNLNTNSVFGYQRWSCFYDERSGTFIITGTDQIALGVNITATTGTGTFSDWLVKNTTTGFTDVSYSSITVGTGAITNIRIPLNEAGAWNVGDSIELINPSSVASGNPVVASMTGTITVISYPVAIVPNFKILPYNAGGIPNGLTSTLATMMGFSTVNSSYVNKITGSHASMLYTEYVDIVSSQLTKNQTLYDRSTNYRTGNNLLARLYIAPDRRYSTTSTNIIGTRPFILDKSFDVPKEINWDDTDPLASINIQLRDSRGNILYAPDVSTITEGFGEFCGNTGYVLMTLGASEASGV